MVSLSRYTVVNSKNSIIFEDSIILYIKIYNIIIIVETVYNREHSIIIVAIVL